MKSPIIFKPLWHFLIRAAYALIFLYFGTLAVTQPETQGMIWVQEPFRSIIASLIPLAVFMTIFGTIQIVLGLSFLYGDKHRYCFALASLLLIGIIINLGTTVGFGNDIVIRDTALLLISVGLLLKKE